MMVKPVVDSIFGDLVESDGDVNWWVEVDNRARRALRDWDCIVRKADGSEIHIK